MRVAQVGLEVIGLLPTAPEGPGSHAYLMAIKVITANDLSTLVSVPHSRSAMNAARTQIKVCLPWRRSLVLDNNCHSKRATKVSLTEVNVPHNEETSLWQPQ